MVGIFDRRIYGLGVKGVKVDRQTRQPVQTMPHSGDIAYDLKGDDAISKKSEFRTLTRERILNPIQGLNLNEVGQNKQLIKRVPKARYVKLD